MLYLFSMTAKKSKWPEFLMAEFVVALDVAFPDSRVHLKITEKESFTLPFSSAIRRGHLSVNQCADASKYSRQAMSKCAGNGDKCFL